jgi:putative endonuclease
MKQHNYYIYITTNPDRTVLYTGVTNDLQNRIVEHYINRGSAVSFAGKYHCYNLVYYEHFHYIQHAIAREKQIKGWKRNRKLELIKSNNPNLDFYNLQICGQWPPNEDAEIRHAYY